MEAIVYSDANRDQAIIFRDLVSKLAGYPIPGIHIGDIHFANYVDLTDTVHNLGWTVHYDDIFQNESTNEWAHIVDANVEALLNNEQAKANLSSEELLLLNTEIVKKVTLDSSWVLD